jgi:hypothetical protein
MFGALVQAVHFFAVPETRATIMLNRKAKEIRKDQPNTNVRGPTEDHKIDWKDVGAIMGRPYKMLVCEPIVGFLSLLSGFADALIFSFLESYGYVFMTKEGWNFDHSQMGLALFALFIGYWAAYFGYLPVLGIHSRQRAEGKALSPESRLWFLQYVVLSLPIGLFGSAFVVKGPPLPWIAPLIFAVFIGWANMVSNPDRIEHQH